MALRSAGRWQLGPHEYYRRNSAPALQIFWLAQGDGSARMADGEVLPVQTGELFVYPLGCEHLLTAGHDGLDAFWWTADGPLAAAIVAGFGLRSGVAHPAGPPPRATFHRLHKLLQELSIAAEYRAAAIAWQLLSRAAERSRQQPSIDPLAERCRALLTERYSDPEFGIEAAANKLGAHRSVLSRRFSAAHGQSPVAYLKALRLQCCLLLLGESDLSVTDIARRSGYSSPHYCARIVRNATGHSPRELRGQNAAPFSSQGNQR